MPNPFETYSEMVAVYGEPSKVIDVPIDDKRRSSHNDVPNQYAVWLDEKIPGGCMIAARYRTDDWFVNPSHYRTLITLLLL